MRRPGGVVFLVGLSVAAALYGLTLPDGLPWRASANFAATVSLAALASGLLGSLVCSYLGWRCGVAAALVWVFSLVSLLTHDRFVRAGRRLFACEALSLANEMDGEAAYSLYRRVEEEIDPGNVSALINMSVMIRCGYAPGTQEESRVRARLEELRKDPVRRSRIREIVRAAGPVRSNPALLEKLVAEARRQVAGKFATGEKVEISPRILTLVEWSNEMCRLMDAGEVEKAGRLARKILSNPDWRGFIPANAVMGAVASREGDYIASEAFFRVATDTTNRVETVVLNNYADTLMHLGKLDEAEAVARRACAPAK